MKFVICRIVGNELPPRDLEGSKLRTLRRILEGGAVAEQFWVLNHLHDSEYRSRVIELLLHHGQRFEELVFDPQQFATLQTSRERIRYAVNINAARNHAVRASQGRYDFVCCLDQDCFFTAPLWAEVTAAVERDQRACPSRRHYGLRMKRVDGLWPAGTDVRPAETAAEEEPQLIFRRDAVRLFDETLPFGEGDKMRLLNRLGYGSSPSYTLTGPACKDVGYVLHLNCGSTRTETVLDERIRQRQTSLNLLLDRLHRSSPAAR